MPACPERSPRLAPLARRPIALLALASSLGLAAPLPAEAQLEADPGVTDRARAWNAALPFDEPGLRAINLGLASPVLDPIMVGLSNRLFLVGAPLIALPYAWSTRGQGAALELGTAVAAAELGAAGLSFGLKALLDRPRAYLVDPQLRTPDGREDSSAMPSGHAAIAFAWATVLAHDEPVLALPAYGVSTAIGLSRIYLGVHYPSDVLIGALLGYGTGMAVLAGRQALRDRGIFPAR